MSEINNNQSPQQNGPNNVQNITYNNYSGSNGNKIDKFLTKSRPPKPELIGREEELDEIERLLTENNQVILVNGLGGVGKTVLCSKYFWEYKNKYNYLGWINYRTSLRESFFLQFKKQPHFVEGESMDERFERIVDMLCSSELENTLLVIDDITNLKDPDLELIRSLPIKVAATSRIELKHFPRYYLGLLPMEECKKLFIKHYELDCDDDYLEKIITLAGRHTLTVELLANTAKNSGVALKQFYSQLEEIGFNLDQVIKEHTGSEWHGEEEDTFFQQLLKVFKLSGISENELYILTNLSIIPNLQVELDELKLWLGLESANDINSLIKKGWLIRGVKKVEEEERHAVYMHPVIGEVIRYWMEPDVEKCRELVGAMIENLSFEPGDNPLTRAQFLPYAEELCRYIMEENSEIATLYNNLASIYRVQGRFEDALEFQLKDIAIREAVFDPSHPELASSYNNLAMIYLDLGRLDKALEFQLKALAIMEAVLDSSHPLLAGSYNNLASIYQAQGRLDKALEYQLKALAIWESMLDSSHPDLAGSYNNLASIYRALGMLDKALDFQLKALAIREKVLDSSHPSLATSYNNLALIYRDLGRLEEALEYQLKALAIWESMLDSSHPLLAGSYNNLASIYRALGMLDKALDFQLQALAIWEKVLESSHPDLARSYNNLAMIYQALGMLDKALEYQLKALAIWEKVLESSHPDLAGSYNNLASIYRALGMLDKALDFQLKALAIREKVLDSSHPDLANSYNNLASIYQALGRLAEALEFQLKAVAIRKAVLDSSHPDLASSYNNLALIYRDLGRLEEALEYQLKALAIREAVLDSSHPLLAGSYNNLAVIYYHMEEYKRAVSYEERSIAILEKNFPDGHPNLDTAKENLELYKRAADEQK